MGGGPPPGRLVTSARRALPAKAEMARKSLPERETFMSRVCVLDSNKHPLMPSNPARARKLL